MVATYESAHDRKVEDEIAGHLAWIWRGKDGGRLGDKNQSDRLILDDGRAPWAVIEIKGRKNAVGRYPTVYLSPNKLASLAEHMATRQCRGFFCPVWYDVIGAISYEAIMAGGFDRRMVATRQPTGEVVDAEVLLIPTSQVVKLAFWWAESLLGKEQRR